MTRCWIFALISLALVLGGCPKRDQPPESSYNPDLIETAKDLAADDGSVDPVNEDDPQQEEGQAECNRETGGCAEGQICWDSWYCKQGRSDQCSAIGDKRCHKKCAQDDDCPEEMPLCRERPLFKGSDRGTMEKFCVPKK